MLKSNLNKKITFHIFHPLFNLELNLNFLKKYINVILRSQIFRQKVIDTATQMKNKKNKKKIKSTYKITRKRESDDPADI